MKHLITAMLLFIATSVSAQIVNIPDPNFKQFLLNFNYANQVINSNGDGEIQTTEAAAFTGQLQIFEFSGNVSQIQDVTGIKAFTSISSLTIYGLPLLTSCDISNMTQLTEADISYCAMLSSVNVDGCANINILHLNGDALNALSISLPKMWSLYLGPNSAPIPELDLTHCDSLRGIDFMMSNVQVLNISGLPKITGFNLSPSASAIAVIARNCTNLLSMSLDGEITFFDVTGCINLTSFISGASLTNLDFSTCSSLKSLRILGPTSERVKLNIKNGSMLSNLQLGGPTPGYDICADDFEVDSTYHLLGVNGPNSQLTISSYCSFFPGGNYNTIKGKIRVDANNNGCDNNDPGINNIPVKLTDNSNGSYELHYTYSGDYRFYPYAGNFTVQPYFAYPYFNFSPSNALIVFDTANSLVDSAHFCVTPNGIHNDLTITMLPISATRAGFTSTYTLVYQNRGTTTLSGDVILNFDNSKMNYNNASLTVTSQSAGQLVWHYNNLLPFQTKMIDVYFYILPPPVNNIADTLMFQAAINPAGNDETPGDNSFTLPQGVRGPMDPNDKECLQGEKISVNSIGKPLDYIIHFQNLGNDTAFNVVVEDQLTDKFDWNTVELTASSHSCELKIKDGKLTFIFEHINLPYSAINEPGSHGFVAFKVKSKSTLIVGDSLNNKAGIYFDFNAPVITNTATTIVSPASNVTVKLEYFSLTTKNESNLLTWKASSTAGTTNFEIERSNDGIHFSNLGNITASVDRCQLPFNFTDGKPFADKTWYRLNIKDADGNAFYSKVLVARKTKSGISVNAVVSNSNQTTIYLDASKVQNIQMRVIADDGRSVYNQNKTIAAGNSTLDLQLKNLATGIYTLIIYTENGELITKRFVK